MPKQYDEHEYGRQEFKARILAHLKTDLEDWEHIEAVHQYIETLIKRIERWYE